MSDQTFRLPPLERAKPSALVNAVRVAHRTFAVMRLAAVTLIAMAVLPTFGATRFGPIVGSVSLTDFTQIWAWVLIAGVLFLVFGMIAAYLSGTGVGPTKVIVIGGISAAVILVSLAGAFFSPNPTAACLTNCGTTNVSQAAFAVSLPFASSYPAGQTLNLAPLSLTIDTVMNASTAAGKMCVQNGVGTTFSCAAAAHNYIVIPVKISRTDSFNQSAGATICINGIPTVTNSTTGVVYSPLGYTAATTSSPGIWKASWSTGSISGANPIQPAPATLSGVACDLVGVPAFGSVTVTLSWSLPGSNSTSANFGYLATQYQALPFQISVTGGQGATPPSIPVNMVFTGVKAA